MSQTQFQLTAARRRLVISDGFISYLKLVSTHSRPKAAGSLDNPAAVSGVFQLTAARRRLVQTSGFPSLFQPFQLTAARRRLGFMK